MPKDLSTLYHEFSKDPTNRGTVYIPRDDSQWPSEWTTIFYKEYERTPKIALPAAHVQGDFSAVVAHRRSRRDFDRAPIDAGQLGSILRCACGITDETGRRAYPSGGARYPIEIYPLVFQGSREVPAGIYHYNVKRHALDVLETRQFTGNEIAGIFTYPFIQKASFALVLTAVFNRTFMKYGDRGYRYILIEAGHVAQNICLTAEALDLKCVPLVGTKDTSMERLLEIDGFTEAVIHSVIVG